MEQQRQLHTFIRDRFINQPLSDLSEADISPIYGYQQMPLLPLEQALQEVISFIPALADYVVQAKKDCNRNSAILNWDESAAIYLYTMPKPFFSLLNEILRYRNRDKLKPWFCFLKLLMHALEKLPSDNTLVWRGVPNNIGSSYIKNGVHTWWSVNSCSRDLAVVKLYLGKTNTVFAIKPLYGKDISSFSSFQTEREVVLLPGTRLRVQSTALDLEDRLSIVHLEEVSQSVQDTPE